MTPRERVLRAFKRAPGLPDRVPVQFGIQSDVSPERVETFIALCRKHGAYGPR